MKHISLVFIASVALAVAACSPSKKSRATPAPEPAVAAPGPIGPVFPSKAPAGVAAPGNDELSAIREKYKDVSMETLEQGYKLYTGVCTNCHKAYSIYNRAESQWQYIIDDMAPKARLTSAEKDAVFKYVLAMKATQPASAK